MTPEPEARVEGPARVVEMCVPYWVRIGERAISQKFLYREDAEYMAKDINEQLAPILSQARHSAIEEAQRICKKLLRCQVIHVGYPDGFTCLDIMDEAESHRDRFTPEWGKRVREGKELCDACSALRQLKTEG